MSIETPESIASRKGFERGEAYGRTQCAKQIADLEAALRACVAAVPTTWLDPLFTGPEGLRYSGNGWLCRDIEKLLNRIRQRILAIPAVEPLVKEKR